MLFNLVHSHNARMYGKKWGNRSRYRKKLVFSIGYVRYGVFNGQFIRQKIPKKYPKNTA